MPTYFKNFNSLRFYAFLSVFIGHVFTGFHLNRSWAIWFSNHFDLAYYGVIFFFVLSGFLITSILLKQKKDFDNINIKNFYIKRIRRIWPIYFIVLIVGFFSVPCIIFIADRLGLNLNSLSGNNFNAIPWFLFFVGNLYISYFGFFTPIIGVLWSVAIEEQFYILWPWFVKYINNAILVVGFLSASFLFSIWFRYFNYGTLSEHLHTLACLGSLGVGCLGAYLTFYNQKILNFFINFKKTYSFIIYFLTTILFIGICLKKELHLDNALGMSSIYAFLTILFVIFILEQGLATKPLISFGKNKITEYLGKISYGLYAYHMVAFTIIITLMKIAHIIIGEDVLLYISSITLVFIITVIISHLSYKYIELPIMTKNRLLSKNKLLL